MAEGARAVITERLTNEGFTSSYCALLLLTALMGVDAEPLNPANEQELFEWRGHFDGLRAALICLARHEGRLEPEVAAHVVGAHIAQAIQDLGRSGGSG